jgi:DNA-directed RNA polymerase subunit N (RpoN/RPB10)
VNNMACFVCGKSIGSDEEHVIEILSSQLRKFGAVTLTPAHPRTVHCQKCHEILREAAAKAMKINLEAGIKFCQICGGQIIFGRCMDCGKVPLSGDRKNL